MKFTLEIECDNEAFCAYGEESLHEETANILGYVSNQVRDGYVKGIVYDMNGNNVGFYKFYED